MNEFEINVYWKGGLKTKLLDGLLLKSLRGNLNCSAEKLSFLLHVGVLTVPRYLIAFARACPLGSPEHEVKKCQPCLYVSGEIVELNRRCVEILAFS